MWSRVLDHGIKAYDLSSLAEADTGTSATPPELIAAVRDALPHTVTRVFYGSTEAGPGTVLAGLVRRTLPEARVASFGAVSDLPGVCALLADAP